MYVSKLQTVFVRIANRICKIVTIFVQIAKCVCPNCKVYSSKLQTVFVQIAKCICWCFECNRVPVVQQWLRAAIPSHQHLALKLYGFGHNMLPASIGSKSFSHEMIMLEIKLLKYAISLPFCPSWKIGVTSPLSQIWLGDNLTSELVTQKQRQHNTCWIPRCANAIC